MRNIENDVETFFKKLGRFRIPKFGIVQKILQKSSILDFILSILCCVEL